MSPENGALTTVDPQPPSADADLLGDLLGPLAIEGPPASAVQSQHNIVSGLESDGVVEAAAIVPVDEPQNSVQVLFIVCV